MSSALLKCTPPHRLPPLASPRPSAPATAANASGKPLTQRAPRPRRSTLRAIAPPAASLEPEAECSRAVYEATVLHLLQQDCDAQLQRALNKEDFELAQALRAQRTRVDEALVKVKAFREAAAAGGEGPLAAAAGAGGGGTPSSSDSIEEGLAALRLRSELAVAVEEEDYATASRLRDDLQALEAKATSAQNNAARAAEFAAASSPPAFRLGQRVTHVRLGYRAAVAGWDAACMESPDWRAAAGVTPEEAAGPFYHVLIDVRDAPWSEAAGDDGPPAVAYLPESRLAAPAPPDTWADLHPLPEGGLDHPFAYLLFLGPDARGDLIPSRALRERFGVERRDVGPA